jgi:uncharacterized phage-associated protein
MRPVRLRFNEAKAAEVAARLLYLRGGTMAYMKLIKLMYLIDREALYRWGRPVSTDRFVSMKHGPVLSRVLDLINHGPDPGDDSKWARLISPPAGYEVSLQAAGAPPDDELSRAEVELIDDVYREHGHKNRWQLVEMLHGFPEWQGPEETSTSVEYDDVLQALGKPPEDIEAIREELESVAAIERVCS